jgi:hypothetical protein
MKLKIFFSLAIISVFSLFVWSEPSYSNPCLPLIEKSITASALRYPHIFTDFSSAVLKNSLSFWYDEFEKADTKEKKVKLYHENQKKRFELVSQFVKKEGNLSLGKTDHPIFSQYHFPQKEGEPIPTFVLALEAQAYFSVFECVLSSQEKESKNLFQDTESLSLLSLSDKISGNAFFETERKIAEETLSLSLESYQSFFETFPQHIAYEKLIEEITHLKKKFASFEKVNTECVPQNHFNASCN